MTAREFENAVVLITGGGTGMGAAFAVELAREGAAVAVCGRRPEPIAAVAEECRGLGVRALATSVDVRDPAAVEAWVAEVAAELGTPTHRSTTRPGASSARRSTSRRTAGGRSSRSS